MYAFSPFLCLVFVSMFSMCRLYCNRWCKLIIHLLCVLCIHTLKLKFTVSICYFFRTWGKFAPAPPPGLQKRYTYFDILMTLGEISPSSASSARCIGQKHQTVILGEISSSPPPVVSLLVLCLIFCPLPHCYLRPPVNKVEPGPNFFQVAFTPLYLWGGTCVGFCSLTHRGASANVAMRHH